MPLSLAARAAALVVTALGVTSLASAQKTTGSIRGVVIDSLVSRKPLGGALVEVVELGRVATTDAIGAFRFDSVPGGRYTLSFSHPMLNEIGFTPPDRAVQLGEGIDVAVTLTTPSGEALYRRLCPGIREPATGVLLGTLRVAGSEAPIAAGEIRGDWTVSTLTRESGFTSRPRVVRAATDSSGRYQLCGVPTDVPVLLRAMAAGVEGPPLELRMRDRVFEVRHVRLATSPAGTGRARIAGRVTSGTTPLADAQVLILGSNRVARTRADGSFELDGLAEGSHTVEARAIGYARERRLIDLAADRVAPLDVSLAKLPVELAEIKVTASAGRAGFDERRRRAIGGYFITGAEIDRRGAVRVEDLFRTVPGIRIEPASATDYRILSYRGGTGFAAVCEPTIYLDAIRIPLDPESGVTLPVMPEELDGIEVYPGPGTAPVEYRAMNQNCGVILLWTKRGRR